MLGQACAPGHSAAGHLMKGIFPKMGIGDRILKNTITHFKVHLLDTPISSYASILN
jgi:hypothetical protein